MLQRQLDSLTQAVARFVETADVVPRDIGYLNHDFAHCRRLDTLQRIVEILEVDRQRIEHLGRKRFLGEVDLGHDPPHRLQRRLAGQRGEVGADKAVGAACERVQVDIGGERHAAGVNAEDLAPSILIGHADDDLAVEAAGAAQRLVDRLGAVACGDDDEILARLDPVHQGQ